jgi:hypothetical protein
MRSLRVVAGAVVVVACALACSPAWAQTPAEEAEAKALEAAKAWLALVDTGQYVKSYYAATQYFRYTVTKEKWDASLRYNRTPLGNVKSRTLEYKKYAVDPANLPKGEYVFIVFKTVFENQPKPRIENITPMLEKGVWKVAGYNIQEAPK